MELGTPVVICLKVIPAWFLGPLMGCGVYWILQVDHRQSFWATYVHNLPWAVGSMLGAILLLIIIFRIRKRRMVIRIKISRRRTIEHRREGE